MKAFWKFLLIKNLPVDSLANTHYAVFGLGDSSYPKFNFVAKRLFQRLKDLGGTSIVRRGDGDDQHEFGLEWELRRWSKELWLALMQLYPLSPGVEVLDAGVLPPPNYQLTILNHKTINANVTPPPTSPPYTQTHPYYATITENRRLTAPDWEQDVRHIEIDIGADSQLTYAVGDVVYIQPRNPLDVVDKFLDMMGLNADTVLEAITPTDCDSFTPFHSSPGLLTLPITLRTLCETYFDLLGTPRRYFFELLSFFATEQTEKERLQYLASAEGQEDLQLYNQRERRNVLDVLQDFPSARPPLQYLFDMITPIAPRAFSISSAQNLYPQRVHITAAVVKYRTSSRRTTKMGLCTSWLASMDAPLPNPTPIPIFVRASGVKPPPPNVPAVLVGPGTGCAMFRAFLQLRRHWASQSISMAPCLFFFGFRHNTKDYLYKEEFDNYCNIVSTDKIYIAFSRDQPQKRYVQHIMKEHSKEVWGIISAGGYFYISGSAKRMPSDVREALREIIQNEHNLNCTYEQAEVYIRDMERNSRYFVETWS
jgi:sulfite reductase alpha subunit-like flavoprotein